MSDEPTVTRDQVERPTHSKRIYGPAAAWPSIVRFGSIENPHPVLRSRGSWQGLAYVRMLLEDEPIVGAILDQWVAQVNTIDITFKPGDQNDEMSIQMAKDATRSWQEIEETPIILDKMMGCSKAYGFQPIEKVFGQFQTTGLLGAVELHDLPPWHIKWGADEKPYFAPTGGFIGFGEPVPDGKMMFARWGSRFSPAGESAVLDMYPCLWRIRVVRKLGLQALEILNRPIPWVKYPNTWDEKEVDDLEAQMVAKYKFCVMTPANVTDVEVEWPTLNVAASGGAGRSEMDVVNAEIRTLYIKFLGTPQTQNEQNASRGLEQVRKEIRDDRTPQAAQLRDGWIKKGWLDDLGHLNWANQPRQIWPVAQTDTSSIAQGIDAKKSEQVILTLTRLALYQITPTVALENIAAIGIPRPKATLMVQSTVAERDSTLRVTPALVSGRSSQQQDEQEAA